MSLIHKPYKYTPIKIYQEEQYMFTVYNPVELMEVQIQVAEQKLENVYGMLNGFKLKIQTNGYLADQPVGYFDEYDKKFDQLFRIKYGNKRKS